MCQIARCPYCKSIWVCWNWVHINIETAVALNPHIPRDELKKTLFGHECWNCGDDIGGACHTTAEKVTNGIPYWILRYIHGLPDIISNQWWRLKKCVKTEP